MMLSAPIPWRYIPVGAIALLDHDDTPRAVLIRDSWHTVMLEGVPAFHPEPTGTVRLVALDTADAMANLRTGGFTTEIIETIDTEESGS